MRRQQGKVIAGVCSGVAYRLGIDPNIVRVLAVVLTLFGGIGILLYSLGWLLMPEESTGQSLGERALRGGGPDGASTLLLALLLVIVAVGFGFAIVGDSWFAITVLAVTLGVGALLLTRPRTGSGSPSAGPTGPPTGYGPAPESGPLPAPAASWAPPTPPAASVPPFPGSSYAPDSPLGPGRPELGPIGGLGTMSAPYPYGPPPSESPAPVAVEPRRRSILGPLTFFAALAAVGILGVVDVLGVTVPAAAYLATALGIVGLGLVVGAWFGRSRSLIALGTVLALLLLPVATVEQLGAGQAFGDSFETRSVAPEDVEEIDGALFEHGAGDVSYDFSGIDFTDRSVSTEVRVGAGNLDITIPEDVTLEFEAQVGAGQLDVLGESKEGLGLSQDQTFNRDVEGGTLELDISMGFGNVEVRRADA
jgi:phage shock protein PspC (stress-responsive transcriptional regulator)